MKKLSVVLMVVLVAAAGVGAREIDESKPADRNGTVEISVINSAVTIVGWDRAEVRLTGDLAAGPGDLTFLSEGGRTVIEVEALDEGGSELTVHVPRGSEIRAETLAAGVTARDLEGVVVIESVAGPIVVEGSPAEVTLGTAAGPITVKAGTLARAEIESMAGPIEIDAVPSRDGRWEIEAVSSPVTLTLPADVSARIEADSFSGAIVNELGPAAEKSSSMLPSMELRFTAGGGDATIRIETVSGPITFAER